MTVQVDPAEPRAAAQLPIDPDVVAEITERTTRWRPSSAVLPGPGPTAVGPDVPVPTIAPEEAFSDAAQPAVMPDVAREIFHLARRTAIQVDLAAAMRVLDHGVSRLTDSPQAGCIFDPELASAWTAPGASVSGAPDDELRHLAAHVARSGQRVVLAHALAEPVGPSPVRAVLVARRPDDRAPYGAHDVATIAAVASAVAGLVGHFAADHAARRDQAARDARLPFRTEALAARRGEVASPGRLVAPPRTWMRRAYPVLVGMVVTVIVAAAVIQVPAYSTGIAVVTVDGQVVTSPSSGTVAELLVAPGSQVAAGDPVLRLHAVEESAEFAATETDYQNALATFLTTPGDSALRGSLSASATRRERARAALAARTLHAPIAGVIGDVRVHPGQLVTAGSPVMQVAATPNLSVVAVLPGIDRPRLAAGMTLQIEFIGYHKRREEAVIDAIGTQVIGPEEARRTVGTQIGDALPISGPVVLVRAHLATRTFESDGHAYSFYDGMVGKAEVEVDTKRLLRLLLPGKRD